ncbi:MAG: hypothetical protein ACJ72N_01200 [Labedaea sp.]
MSDQAPANPAGPAAGLQPEPNRPSDAPDQDAAAPTGEPEDQPAKSDESEGDAARRLATAAAATNPGSTAAKRRQRNAGRQNLGFTDANSVDFDGNVTVQGDMAARDMFNIVTGGAVEFDDTYEISPDDLTGLAGCHVRPAGFDGLVSFCASQSVTVVRVGTGQGKLTSAALVLSELNAFPLYRLSPAKRLDQLSPTDIEDNAGYVLTGLTQDQANTSLTRHTLDRLLAELASKNARLVVAVSAETRLSHLTSARYVTELADSAALPDVLLAHLRHHLGAGPAERLLGDPDLAALTSAEFPPGAGLRKTVLLATLLVRAYREARPVKEIVEEVRRQLAARAAQEFVEWFEGLGTLDRHSFVIALAVLNGLSYETVVNASRAIEFRLTRPVRGDVEDIAREQVQPFRTSRSVLLKEYDAKLVTAVTSTPQGDLPVTTVMFNDADRPKRLLFHLWHEYGEAHQAIIGWLRELGEHPMEEVRTRAGVAAGMLSSISFEHLQHAVIEPWAASTNAVLRETAAIALDTANSIPALKDSVQNLVHDWCMSDDEELIATAVRAYGSSVGLDQRARLFETLGEQAESQSVIVTAAVCTSLTELVEAGKAGVSDRALVTAKQWTASRDKLRRFTGNVAFLTMAADLLWVPGDGAVPHGKAGRLKHWPFLLRLAESSPEWREVIAEQWAAALCGGDTAEGALEVLDRWVEGAEPDTARREALVRVLNAASTADRARARLHRAAKRWADKENSVHAPIIAGRIHPTGTTFRERTSAR